MPYTEILKSRSDPGICILNLRKEVLFVNQIALEICGVIRSKAPSQSARTVFRVPECILALCDELDRKIRHLGPNSCPDSVYMKEAVRIGNGYFMASAFAVSESNKEASTHFLILLRKITSRAESHPNLFGNPYGLTQKESRIVQLLTEGLTNKEIARALDLAESTVKEYVHKVMRKVKASTRAGVVARVLSSSRK
jgi:DNA-binding CsgD family transcriptional regulator